MTLRNLARLGLALLLVTGLLAGGVKAQATTPAATSQTNGPKNAPPTKMPRCPSGRAKKAVSSATRMWVLAATSKPPACPPW